MRVFYEVDPFNRLIVKSPRRKSRLKKFRQILYGAFKADSRNILYYEVFKSSGTSIPQKIKFSGRYSLDKRHNLIFTLNKWGNQYEGNRLRLRTKIINASGSEIAFLLSSKESMYKRSTYTLRLHGSWQADKNNRLIFGVKREKDNSDRLTFFKAWNINRNNEIEYTCGQHSRAIKLKGHWVIKDKYRLGYILDKKFNSGFDFKASLGQILLKDNKTYLKFDIVIGVSKTNRVRRKIIFIGDCRFQNDSKVILKIYPDRRKVSLKLARKVLSQKGLAYIEALLGGKERYLGGGIAFRW